MKQHKTISLFITSLFVFFFSNISTLFAQDAFGGLALYTLRDDMAKSPKTTLQAVADAGYVAIEAAGYEEGKFYDYSPLEFKALLSSLNLTPLSSHNSDVSLDNAEIGRAHV